MNAEAGFILHPQLDADGHTLADAPLCRLLLARDARYPWCILVPRRPRLREVYELDEAGRHQLLEESCELGEAMMRAFAGDKLNVAALGNMVPQLHVHHIVRHQGDAAWPGPVWGKLPPLAYESAQLGERVGRLRAALGSRWQWR